MRGKKMIFKTEFPKIKTMNSTLLTYMNSSSKSKFSTILMLLFLVIGFTNATAQVSTYTKEQFASPGYVDLPLATKTIIYGGIWDDPTPVSIPIGFTFNINGANYNSAFVSANGFITFGGTAPSATSTTPLNTLVGDYAIAAYAWDLSVYGSFGAPQTNAVAYELSGTAPNRILKIEWRDARRAKASDSNITFSMQLWLYETTNIIETHYKTQGGLAFSVVSTGQVGLRGTNTADYNNWSHGNTNWPIAPATMTPGTAGNATVRIRTATGVISTGAVRLFRWTPNPCNAPNGLSMSNVLINTATINFTEPLPIPANPYQYEIRTSGAPGTALGALDVSGTSATSPINVTGLTPNTAYTAYIRSDCGSGNFSSWVSVGTFTTLCNALTVPYLQDFEGTTAPTIPTCTSVQNIGTGNLWSIANADGESGFFDNHLIYNQSGTQPANVWFYTEGIQLTAGTTYRMDYLYGGSSVPSTITNRMEVKYGLQPRNEFMTIPLDNHPNIKGSPNGNVVYFTAPTSDVYYFGFRAYSLAAQGKLFVEEIQINVANCLPPTGLTASSVASTSATVSWTPPATPPANGYPYFITTTNPVVNANSGLMVVGQTYRITSVGTTNFTTIGATSNTVGTTFVATAPPVTAGAFVVGQTYTINALGTTNFTSIGATSNSIGIQFIATGVGTGTGNAIPAQTTAAGDGVVEIVLGNNVTPSGTVGPGIPFVNLTGLANNTTYYIWVRSRCSISDISAWSNYTSFTTLNVPAYCIPSSASATTFINNFTTTNGVTNITNLSGFSLPTGYGDFTSQIVTQAPGFSIGFTVGVTTPINTGIAIWVDWNNDGTFDVSERMYNSAAYVTGATGSFVVPAVATGFYRMRVLTDYWATNPTPCVINTNFGNQQGETEDYTLRVVPPPPPLTLSSIASSQCANTASPLVTLTAGGPPTYDSFTWSPATGVSGSAAAGWTFTNTTTTVYTLTAVQTSAPFSINTARFTYTATPAPTAVTVTPDSPTVCQSGPAQLLTATGGIVNNSLALSEDFEAGAPTWTRINLSTGGAVANAAWTERPNGYNYGGVYNSNDSSTFIMANSDAQGSGTTTSVSLVSPVFSLANYSTANLNFYHYYQGFFNGSAVVQISTDGGATWLPGALATYTTTNQGTRTNFALVTINLATYLGQSNLRIRFRYDAQWAWHWAIDNVTVSGTRNAQIVWNTTPPTAGTDFVTPIPGLFTDAAGTIPYTLNTISSTVFAMPSANTVYTGSTNAAGCAASATATITVTPVVAGTVSGTQSNCDVTAFTNLTLTGFSGSVVRWEHADNPAFTVGVTPIANTTNTLTPAQFGTFSTIRYFRAVVGNGICNTVNSNIVSVAITSTTLTGTNTWSNGLPDITKRVIIAGNFTANANFSACSVRVLPGATLTVNAGITVTVQNEFVVDGPSLPNTVVFNNGSTLLQNSNATNSGTIRYIRNSSPIIQFDYTYWSSPVANQVLSAFSPNTNVNRFYVFNHTPSVYQWANVSNTSVMDAARGYIIRAPNTISTTVPAPWAGQFFGTPHNGTYSINVVLSGNGDRNLIGNPYPSAISADDLYAENSSVLVGNFYFWTHNTPITANNYNADDYATYNGVGGVGTAAPTTGVNNSAPTGFIGAGQGFFIDAAATGTVNFNNTIRVAGNNGQFYRPAGRNDNATQSIEKHRLWVNIINNQGAYKQALIGYLTGATNDRDMRYDAELTEAGNSVSIYSLLNQDKLTIQGRALPFENTDVIPLGVRTTLPGEYAIQLENFDGLFAQGQNIYLEDKLLGIVHDLKAGDYTFSTTGGTMDDRFEIQFEDGTLSLDNPIDVANAVVVYKNNQIIHINAGNITMTDVKIFDTRGRLITSKSDVQATEVQFDELFVANQVLLIQITTENGERLTKKIAY